MRLKSTFAVLLLTHLFSYTANATSNYSTDKHSKKQIKHTTRHSKTQKKIPLAHHKHANNAIFVIDRNRKTTRNAHLYRNVANDRTYQSQYITTHIRNKKGRVSLSSSAIPEDIANMLLSDYDDSPISLSPAHKARYRTAKQTAMVKLMEQLGKPYRWGGTSPTTGFDCSGLIYYAYRNLVNIKLPRTANEMYHFRDAPPIAKNNLQRGDLVFFRIHGTAAADHVGVYLGNGKFIQSPRTGSDIRISQLSSSYWQEHYVGARRVITPNNIL